MNITSNIATSLNTKCCNLQSAIFINILILVLFSLIIGICPVYGQRFANAIGTGKGGSDTGVKSVARGNGMSFAPNKGQIVDMDGKLRPDVLYHGGGGGADVYLRLTGMSYVYTNMGEVINEADEYVENLIESGIITESDENEKKEDFLRTQNVKMHRVDMDFLNCMTSISCVNEDELEGCENYYYAHCPLGVTNVKQYNRVTYKNIYKNIDVVYCGDRQNGIKYDLVVQPHADPNQIQLNWKGAEHIYIDRQGGLVIKTSVNEFYESIPRVYQNINGQIVDVDARYILNGTVVTFELGTWNPEFPLIIDPWATYFSGTSGAIQSCSGSDIATDGFGNVASTGWTASGSLPVSAGSFQASYRGSGDCFVTKFSISGARIFGTYFGGSSNDYGFGLTIDGNNDILVSGKTQSGNFPTMNAGGGAYFQAASAGGFDAFIAKFTPAGVLTWSTLYGGSLADEGIDVKTDGANNVVLVGTTQSVSFPVQAPYQAVIGAGATQNAFVVKFNSNCVRQWATYYGGSSRDGAVGVACNAVGDIFVTGYTSSTNFPVMSGYQMTSGGSTDAFALKLSGANGFPVWSTYYGGSDIDHSFSIAVDGAGDVVFVGNMRSTGFIQSSGANQTIIGGGMGDAFIAKFNTSGNRLWGTYHGGSDWEVSAGCAIDANNNIYWYGEIEDSPPRSFFVSQCAYQPYRYQHQPQIAGPDDEDFYISKFDPNGTLLCTTTFGGPNEEDGDQNPHTDIAIFGKYIYATGWVSDNFPVTSGAFQTTSVPRPNGGNAFIAQLCINICQPKFIGIDNVAASQTIVCPNVPIAFTSAVNKTTCSDTTLKFKWTFTGGTPNTSIVQNPTITYSTPGLYTVKLVVNNLCQTDSVIKTNYILVQPCAISASATGATVCPNSCANITAAGLSGTNPYTYKWSTGANTSVINVCPAATTAYTVTVTDASGNSATVAALVNVRFSVIATTSSSNIKCNNVVKTGDAFVQVTTGVWSYSYSWSNGFTTQWATGLTAGNHTVTVTDGDGCKITKVVTIVDPNPVASFTKPATICVGSGSIFTFTGTTGVDMRYSWTVGAPVNVSGTTSSFSYTFLTAGSYSITYSVSNQNPNYIGCSASTTNTVTVISCTGPIVTATGSSVCPGFCASVTSIGTGGTVPYTYSWSNGATTQNINSCPATTTTYTVIIKDAGGNTSTSSAVVTVNPGITVTTVATTINCNGSTGSVSASGSNGTSPYTYVWSNGSTGAVVSGLAGAGYTITVTDGKGCTGVSTATIVSPPPLVGQITKGTAACMGCGCKEWIMVTATGGTSPYSYTWPDGYINRYKNNLCPGAYLVNVKDKNGCSVNVNVATP
ncbi:MAG: PKD domain-containing protein [Bacteroidetes bacterium]|nr:PKD domain-containing protein [Bacteroidota bacterium]